MPGYTTLLTALGWTLMNSFWQMAIVWMAYYLLTGANKRLTAAVKHNLALVFITIGSGWVILSFFQLLEDPVKGVISGFIPVGPQINRWIPGISSLYLLILFIRIVYDGFQFIESVKNKSGHSPSPVLQLFVDRQSRMLGITKKIRLFISDRVETAETSRYLKPLILLPASLMSCLSPEQVEAILVHELFHIRRNDYLINIYLSCFRGILFFNPFVHLFYAEISRERENACDDEVIERGFAPAVYAEALYCLEKYRQVYRGFSIAADGNKPWLLMERIRRVLGKPDFRKSRFRPAIVCSLIISIGFFGIQQKTLMPQRPSAFSPVQKPILVLPDKLTGMILIQPEIRTLPVSKVVHKLVRRKAAEKIMLSELMPDPGTPEAEYPADNAYFADHTIARDYSNQQTEGSNTNTIPTVPGTPYVPTASLSYEPLPNLTREDSLQNLVVQDRLKEMLKQTRIVAATRLSRLQTEIDRNKKQLKKMELKNRQLLIQHQGNIKPLLENIQLELQKKELQIDRIKSGLQATDEEIIHI